MQYVCSDIHGCYDRYMELLKAIRLGPRDVLYLLGDTTDRGPDGLRTLLDALSRPNVIPLAGNHELVAALLLPWAMKEVTIDEVEDPKKLMEWLEDIASWRKDGGDTTLAELKRLSEEQRQQVLDTLAELPAYEEVEAGGNRFILSHAGLGPNADPSRPLEDYSLVELLFEPPDLSKPWNSDTYVVFGHTPTRYLFAQESRSSLIEPDPDLYQDKIYRRGRFIGIDCACVFGGRLGCLCLDTLEEFYV